MELAKKLKTCINLRHDSLIHLPSQASCFYLLNMQWYPHKLKYSLLDPTKNLLINSFSINNRLFYRVVSNHYVGKIKNGERQTEETIFSNVGL